MINNNIIINGKVDNAKLAYQRYSRVKPLKIDYGNNYYKYNCPVCVILGNKHQIGKKQKNCPLCNVNLYWEDE